MFLVALLAGVFGVSAYAKHFENEFFSIEVADEWRIEKEEQGASFYAPNNEAALSMVVVDNEGKDKGRNRNASKRTRNKRT